MPWSLVAGGQVQNSRLCVRDEGCCLSKIPHPESIAGCPATDLQQPATKASHTIGSNNTHMVSSSWWWAQKCPKHVEHIISSIKYSVASSLLYAYATMHGQTHIKKASSLNCWKGIHSLECTNQNQSLSADRDKVLNFCKQQDIHFLTGKFVAGSWEKRCLMYFPGIITIETNIKELDW